MTQSLPSSARLFIVSDIHSNLPALETVLMMADKNDTIVCLGDLIGYYAEPNEVCELIRRRATYVILGNHDAYVLGILPFRIENEQKYRVYWTREQLSQKNKEWLKSLPFEIQLKLDKSVFVETPIGKVKIDRLYLTHGGPNNIEHYLYPDKLISSSIPLGTCLLMGHTHHPMIRIESFGLALNPGSVGQPRDWNPKSSFMIVDLENGRVLKKRVTYNVESYGSRLRNMLFDSEAIDILARKR